MTPSPALRILVLIAAAALAACAGVRQAEPDPVEDGYWKRTWAGALTTSIHAVSASPWGPGVQGWTICDKVRRHCDVIIVAGVDRDCVLRHELKGHAAGLDHPDHLQAFICPRTGF